MFTIMFIIMFIIMFTSMFIIRFTIMVTIGFAITFSDNFTLSRLCDLRRIVTWRCWCTALGCGLGDWCRRDWCLAAAGAIGWAGLLLGIVALQWLGSLASLFRRFRLKKLAPGLLELVLEPCLAVQELKPCFYCTYVISFCTSIITYVIVFLHIHKQAFWKRHCILSSCRPAWCMPCRCWGLLEIPFSKCQPQTPCGR